jgi:hypothetical protein
VSFYSESPKREKFPRTLIYVLNAVNIIAFVIRKKEFEGWQSGPNIRSI